MSKSLNKYNTKSKTSQLNQAACNEKNKVISSSNLEQTAQRIALRALKTIVNAGGAVKDGDKVKTGAYEFMVKLYHGLIFDIKNPDLPRSDGYDLVQTAALALIPYIGKNIEEVAYTDSNGREITILRHAFRQVNNAVYTERKKQYKQCYIDDLNGNLIVVPPLYDINNVMAYRRITTAIRSLNISNQQRRIVNYLMQGRNPNQIAKLMSVKRSTIYRHIAVIAEKTRQLFGLDKFTNTINDLLKVERETAEKTDK